MELIQHETIKRNPDPLKVFWCGGVFRHDVMARGTAIAPAANNWQSRVIGELKRNGHQVHHLAHHPKRVFPHGELFPGRPNDFEENFPTQLVRHINLPMLRTPSLITGFQRAFLRAVRRWGAPDCLITYNPMPWNSTLGRWVQRRQRIPWICINLDFGDPGEDWQRFRRAAGGAAGQVFLSHYAFETCPIGPKYHFDALSSYSEARWKRSEATRKNEGSRSIVFTGAFSKWTGVDELVEAFCLLDPKDCYLDLSGHATERKASSLAQRHPRIRYHGLVDQERLESLCAGADLLVNPRPNRFVDNAMNFPSKLMEYLSYGVPIISTWTPGLAPIYRDLILETEDSPECLANGIQIGLNLSAEEQSALRHRIQKFLLEKRDPNSMIQSLCQWIQCLPTPL